MDERLLNELNINIDNIYYEMKMEYKLNDLDFSISKDQFSRKIMDCFCTVENEINEIKNDGLKTIDIENRNSRKSTNIFLNLKKLLISMISLLSLNQNSDIYSCLAVIIPILITLYESFNISLNSDEIMIYHCICDANSKGIELTKNDISAFMKEKMDLSMHDKTIFFTIDSLKEKQIIDEKNGNLIAIEDFKIK